MTITIPPAVGSNLRKVAAEYGGKVTPEQIALVFLQAGAQCVAITSAAAQTLDLRSKPTGKAN